MRRREFIALVGGMAPVWSTAAPQQRFRMGLLSDPELHLLQLALPV
jgi:hypothetical protein